MRRVGCRRSHTAWAQSGLVCSLQAPLQLQNATALLGAETAQLAGVKRERSGRASLDEKMQQYAEAIFCCPAKACCELSSLSQVVEFIVDPSSQLQPMTVTGMLRNIGRKRHMADGSEINCATSRAWEICDQLLQSVVGGHRCGTMMQLSI